MMVLMTVICDTALIEICLEPSVLAMLCHLLSSRRVYLHLTEQVTLEVSFDDDGGGDDYDAHTHTHIYIYIYICLLKR